jgi:hypothetical protein
MGGAIAGTFPGRIDSVGEQGHDAARDGSAPVELAARGRSASRNTEQATCARRQARKPG